MVYVDGTEESISAAEYAIALSLRTGAELSAAFIVNTRALLELRKARIFLEAEAADYQRDIENDSRRYLELVKNLGQSKGVVVQTFVRSGNVHEEMKRLVKEEKVDLLCIGDISNIRSRRDEMYDETDRTFRSVPCSVLVVRDPDRVSEIFESIG
jgi:nucleotide-binding universal stress UspA family protein